MQAQEMCRCYKQHEDALTDHRPKMDPARKAQLKALLASQASKSDT